MYMVFNFIKNIRKIKNLNAKFNFIILIFKSKIKFLIFSKRNNFQIKKKKNLPIDKGIIALLGFGLILRDSTT